MPFIVLRDKAMSLIPAVSPAEASLPEQHENQGRPSLRLRFLLPTPFRANLLESLADLADELAGGQVYFKASGEVELILAGEEQFAEASRRAVKLGIYLKESESPSPAVHCPGLLFCHRAAVETLGSALAVTAILERKYVAWPAPLKVSLCGCARRCEADLTSDLLIEGYFLKPPDLNHAYLNHHPKRKELVAECPGRALNFKIVAENSEYFDSLELDKDKCLACGQCGFDNSGFTFKGGLEGAAFNLYVGGRYWPGERIAYPRLIRERLADNPPYWPELSEAVGSIVSDWQIHANPKERLLEYVERLGWAAWLKRFTY